MYVREDYRFFHEFLENCLFSSFLTFGPRLNPHLTPQENEDGILGDGQMFGLGIWK